MNESIKAYASQKKSPCFQKWGKIEPKSKIKHEPITKKESENLTIINEKDCNTSNLSFLFGNSNRSLKRQRSLREIDYENKHNFFQTFNLDSPNDEFVDNNNISLIIYPKEEYEDNASFIDYNRLDITSLKKEQQKNYSKPNSTIIRTSVKRKQGAGRKTVNPDMEKIVVCWVVEYIRQNSNINRIYAKKKRNHQNSKELCQ